jgi:hypothetical protein
MRINHVEDADIATLRNILVRLYDATRLSDDERRDLATIMHLILDRIETADVEVKEPEHG